MGIGGGWPLQGPMKRAARWDGACFYKHKTHYLSPADVRAIKGFVAGHPGSTANYDVIVGGSPRREEWEEERVYIQALAEAGMTWWLEYIPPDTDSLKAVRMSIKRGPLTID